MGRSVGISSSSKALARDQAVVRDVEIWKRTREEYRQKATNLAKKHGISVKEMRGYLKPHSKTFKRAKTRIEALKKVVKTRDFKSAVAIHKSLKKPAYGLLKIQRIRRPILQKIRAKKLAKKRSNYVDMKTLTPQDHAWYSHCAYNHGWADWGN